MHIDKQLNERLLMYYLSAYISVCMYVCMCVCVYVCMYVPVCVCVYVCMYVCMVVCVCVCEWMDGLLGCGWLWERMGGGMNTCTSLHTNRSNSDPCVHLTLSNILDFIMRYVLPPVAISHPLIT